MLIFDNPFPKRWLNSSELQENNAEFEEFFNDLIKQHKPHEIEIEYMVLGTEGIKEGPNKERFIGFATAGSRFIVHLDIKSTETKYKFNVSPREFKAWKEPLEWNSSSGFAISTSEVEKIIFHFDQSAPNKKKSGVLENYDND